jgi:hypothetical protein
MWFLELKIKLNRIQIANKNSVRIIGVISDTRLIWISYIKLTKKNQWPDHKN